MTRRSTSARWSRPCSGSIRCGTSSFPAEQARILQLLVARVMVRLDGLEISLRVEGIGSLVEELRLREARGAAAA